MSYEAKRPCSCEHLVIAPQLSGTPGVVRFTKLSDSPGCYGEVWSWELQLLPVKTRPVETGEAHRLVELGRGHIVVDAVDDRGLAALVPKAAQAF